METAVPAWRPRETLEPVGRVAWTACFHVTIIGSVEGNEGAVPVTIRATHLVKEESMRGIAFMFLTGIVIGALGSDRVRGDEPKAAAGQQVATTFDGNVHVTLKYLLYLPPDYDKHDKWPLVLFLHGAGERGDDLNAVKRHGPPKLIEGGKQFPFIVVSPQCPKDHWWNNELVSLTALLDDVVAKHKVDPDRVYLTGLSMGGFGTSALAGYTPNRFAALIPICGGGEPLLARAIKHVPVWAFHGGKDPIVPVKRSEDSDRRASAQSRRCQDHDLSGGGPRFVDGDLRQSGNLRVAALA